MPSRTLLDLVNGAQRNERWAKITFSDADLLKLWAGTAFEGGQGTPGEQGPPGIPGAGMTWLGPWSSGLYLAGDGVSHLGSAYIATIDTTNTPPHADWDLVAAKGDNGPQGTTGATGSQGIQGATGSTGPQGDAGAAGAAGPNTVTTATTTNITGLLKGNGSVVSAASAPSDFVATGDSRLSDARTPTSHVHAQADITSLVSDLAAKQPLDSDLTTLAGLTATTDNFIISASSAWASRTPAQAKTSLALVKGDVGLGNVDNVADTGKPVSTAQQTALNLKANLASPTFTGTVAGVTKAMVGLTNADDTTDANKPVSLATTTALNLKANLASPTFTGTVTVPGLTVADATDLTISATTGTKIGQSGSKIGFYGVTPAVRPGVLTQTYNTTSTTHAAVTQLAAPAGGTGLAAGAWSTAANRDLAITSINAARTDIANLKNFVNSVVDQLQSLGLLQ